MKTDDMLSIKLFLKIGGFLMLSFIAYKIYHAIYVTPGEDRQYVIDLKKAKEKNKAFLTYKFKNVAFEGTVISNTHERVYNSYKRFDFDVIKLKASIIDIPIDTKNRYKCFYDFTNKDKSLVYLNQSREVDSHTWSIEGGDKIIKRKGDKFYIVFYKGDRYEPEIINLPLEDIFWE